MAGNETNPDRASRASVPSEIERQFEAIVEGPEVEHETRVEELCRAHPEHAPVLWRWLAVSRRLSAPPDKGPVPAFDLGHPDHVGPYRVLEKLGQGGMGAVYRAQHGQSGRTVALKMIRPEFLDSEVARKRFQREVQAVSRLDHPCICRVYEVGDESGVPYMALQLVDGVDLGQRIANAKQSSSSDDSGCAPLPVPASPGARPSTFGTARGEILAVVRLFERVARAVHTAHEHGLVHRDIKPGNLMVTAEGEPVVLDFGLALDESAKGSVLSLPGEFLGTVEYMAPEQVSGGTVDCRTDVYSIGVSLYESLSLELPIRGGSRAEIPARIIHEEPLRLRRLNRAVPRDLEVVVHKAIDKHPGRRYASGLELAEDLRRVCAIEPVLARPAGPVLRLQRWARRNPVATLLLLTFTVGLAGSTWQFVRAEGALGEFNLLAHNVKFREAMAARSALYPAWPDKAERMRRWLRDEADPLIASSSDLERTLSELRAEASPWTVAERQKDRQNHPDAARLDHGKRELVALRKEREETKGDDRKSTLRRGWMNEEIVRIEAEIAVLTESVKERITFRLPRPSRQFLHDALAELIADLQLFADPKTGARASVARDLAWAETVRQHSITVHEQRWRDAAAAIETSDKYHDLHLPPQIGLVPIGPDPRSGLWEFVHLRSSRTGSPLPSRDPDTGRFVFTEDTGIIFVLLPGGLFKMGGQKDDDQKPNYDELADPVQGPVHDVTLDPFFISKYEMSQGQWFRLSGGEMPSYYHPKELKDGTLKQIFTLKSPVEQVSWRRCDTLLRKFRLDLPTEAQWEYAARAGTSTPWWTGTEPLGLRGAVNLADVTAQKDGVLWKDLCLWLEDGYVVHAPVDTMKPNPFGLHNVIGNVWEWCLDSWEAYTTPVHEGTGLRHAVNLSRRVYRGGSCADGLGYGRVGLRAGTKPDNSGWHEGVRPARRITVD